MQCIVPTMGNRQSTGIDGKWIQGDRKAAAVEARQWNRDRENTFPACLEVEGPRQRKEETDERTDGN